MISNEKITQLIRQLKIVRDLQRKYTLQSDSVEKYLVVENFRITTPIVGKFSSGKSSLLNALLGKNYLSTDLTPETSVPTEIFFDTKDTASVFEKSDTIREVDIAEFVGKTFRADNVSKVQLALNNEFLKTIPNVKIVDMPGFDSGIELHNKAIDDYLVDSRAYVLTFAATEPVIPESIANFLRELKLYRMPVYVVITKSKSVTTTQLKSCVENISRNAAEHLGLPNVEICCTNAKGKVVDVQTFAEVLWKIEADAQKIFADELTEILHAEVARTAKFLRSVMQQTDLTPSELESQKETCRRNLERLKDNLVHTRQEFSKQVDACINAVQAEVSESLYNSAASLETALMNRADINDRVNSLVRETVIRSMQAEFAPKFRRYVEKVNAQINLNVGADFEFREKNLAIETAVQATISKVVKKAVPAILSLFGLAVSAPIVALISFAASLFVSSAVEENRRNEQRMQIRRRLHNEIIPQIVARVDETLRQQIYSQLDDINARIDAEAQKVIDDHEKTLDVLNKNFELETFAKRDKLQQMNSDLETLSTLMTTDFLEVPT